jgi:hypothetical protein
MLTEERIGGEPHRKMKKFLIGTVFIIPIIIVLAISATGKIIALKNPLNASRMELRNSNNEVIVPNVNDTFYVDATDDTQFIIAELFPLITDQRIIYKVNEEIPNAGDVDLVRIDETNRYRFVPVFDEYGMARSGVAEVTIYPANNVSISQTITVVIKSEVISDMVIYNEEGETLDGGIALSAPVQLYCDIVPMDALDYESFAWTTSDPSVASVSENGLVTPESEGYATITARALDKAGKLHSVSVIADTTHAIVRAVNVKSASFSGLDWVRQHLVIASSAQIADAGGGRYYVSAYGKTVTVSVGSCGYGDVEFDGQRLIYTQNGPFYIRLKYSDYTRKSEKADAVIESDNPAILYADNHDGIAVAQKAGKATLSAVCGNFHASAVYTIKERPYSFNLKYSKADSELGIQRTRVWGTKWLTPDFQFSNEFCMTTSLAQDQADLIWETDNPEYATVDDCGRISFYPASAGHNIVVRATVAVHNYKTAIYRQFVFRMAGNPDSVNVYNFEEFSFAAEQNAPDIIMQANIQATDKRNVNVSVYGNGFLYDAKSIPDGDSDGILRLNRGGLPDVSKRIVFEEIWIEAAQPEADLKKRLSCIFIDDVENPVEINFCILQYAKTSIRLYKARNVTIEGCILGNTGYVSIEVMQDNVPSYITLRNVVMRQSDSPSIMVAPSDFYPELFDKNIMPYITIEGFLDMTNWMLPNHLSGILGGLDPSSLSGIADFVNPQSILNVITKLVEEIFQRPDNSYLLYTNPTDGQKYICAGGFFMGLYVKPDPNNVTIQRESLKLLPVVFPTDDSTPGVFVSWVDAITKSNLNMTIRHPSYILSYDFTDGKKPKYGPGDSIPQDFTLYQRLVSGEDITEKEIKTAG